MPSTSLKIFVTGASGGLGSHLLPKLISAGHTVIGQGRSDASVTKIEAFGAKSLKADLLDLHAISQAAAEADVVVHLAFDHGQLFGGDFVGACRKDATVIKAIGGALASSGQDKVLMFATDTLGIDGPTEQSAAYPKTADTPRYMPVEAAYAFVSDRVRVIELRIAAITYPEDRLAEWIHAWSEASKIKGYVPYIDIANAPTSSFTRSEAGESKVEAAAAAWNASSYDDAASLIALTVEPEVYNRLPNPASLHVVAEDQVPFSACADIISAKLRLPKREVQQQEMDAIPMAGLGFARVRHIEADWTKRVTGWTPAGEGLLAHMQRHAM